MHYICLVKMISRLCLICCALSIFINVAFGGSILPTKKALVFSKQTSKEIVFQKVVEDFHLNATELEEDVESDGDDDLHLDFNIVYFQESHSTFQFILPNVFVRKIDFKNIDYRSIRKVPFFITFENFRI